MVFMEMNEIPYTVEAISLVKGKADLKVGLSMSLPKVRSHHLSFFFFAGDTQTNAGLVAANPNKAVPVLDDNGFTMFER